MYTVRPGRGLADVPQTPAALPATILGVPIAQYCSDWIKWPWTGYCWAYSPAAWGQMANFAGQAATIPQPAPPAAVTNYGVSQTEPPTPEQAQAAIQAAIDAAAAKSRADTLAAFQNMIPVLDTGAGDGGGGGLSTLSLIALGLVVGGGVLILVTTGGGRGRR